MLLISDVITPDCSTLCNLTRISATLTLNECVNRAVLGSVKFAEWTGSSVTLYVCFSP